MPLSTTSETILQILGV